MTEPFVVLITGSRDWHDFTMIETELRSLRERHGVSLLIMQGSCKGADLIAESVCKKLEINYIGFPAKWMTFGSPRAGAIRNHEMLTFLRQYLSLDEVLAFHENIENSRGTKNMVNLCKEAGVRIKLFNERGFVKYINPPQMDFFV